jgi:hypothetical protein
MQQVETMPAAFVNKVEDDPWSKPFAEVTVTTREEGFTTATDAVAELQSQLGGTLVAESPICAHGHMLFKSGISPKTNKEYRGYVCTERVKAKQCSALWMTLSSDGTWKQQL